MERVAGLLAGDASKPNSAPPGEKGAPLGMERNAGLLAGVASKPNSAPQGPSDSADAQTRDGRRSNLAQKQQPQQQSQQPQQPRPQQHPQQQSQQPQQEPKMEPKSPKRGPPDPRKGAAGALAAEPVGTLQAQESNAEKSAKSQRAGEKSFENG